jgi:hypothetical protein
MLHKYFKKNKTIHSINIMINHNLNKGNMENAQKYYHKIKTYNLKENEYTYQLFITGFYIK